jgi:hypothetical protein
MTNLTDIDRAQWRDAYKAGFAASRRATTTHGADADMTPALARFTNRATDLYLATVTDGFTTGWNDYQVDNEYNPAYH